VSYPPAVSVRPDGMLTALAVGPARVVVNGTAPSTVGSEQYAIITATSVANPTMSGSTPLTIYPAAGISVSPASVSLGSDGHRFRRERRFARFRGDGNC
jgi:hypothetical protein